MVQYHGVCKGYLYTSAAVRRKQKGHCWEQCMACLETSDRIVLLEAGGITHTVLLKRASWHDPVHQLTIARGVSHTQTLRAIRQYYQQKWGVSHVAATVSVARLVQGESEPHFYAKIARKK